MFLILILALAVGGASASELDDFTNNLATDLGPLLALFGEGMTKQYLSESTKFVDYLIFAMAPIGIITALVSVIRVCGDRSLRAFIGKAQEADSAIEAELCTSTSRDVCELFNQTGITRTLGRASLLELVFYPGEAKNTPHMGIHIFQHHLSEDGGEWRGKEKPCPASDRADEPPKPPPSRSAATPTPDIEAARGSIERSEKSSGASVHSSTVQDEDAAPAGQPESSTPKNTSPPAAIGKVAPVPNLSLNVGIITPSPWVFYIVAAMGVALQVSVMAMAGLVSWKAAWAARGESAAFAHNKSALIFIVGTAAMCGGMLLCAALIGEATQKTTYSRKTTPPAGSRLLWLQPGDQVIGGQSFDAYAYLEESNAQSNKLISHYMTSSKRKDPPRFYLYTWFAVIITMGGYLAQFIGVRGMSAYVSIAQFGSTVIMTFLRGLLRARRISKKNNQLANMPGLVAEHELDWLAFRIWRGIDEKYDCDKKYECPLIHIMPFNGETVKDAPPVSGHLSLNDLILIRSRLAYLTGHLPLGKSDSETQEWKDDQVKVRIKARQIADAICDAAEVYIPPKFVHNSFMLSFRIGKTTADRMPTYTEVVELPLTRAGSSGSRVWTVESSKLEAILGLIMWSTLAQDIFKDDDGNQTSNAEKVPNARFVFVDGSKFASVRRSYAKKWMDAKVRGSLVTGTIRLQNSNVLNLSRVWDPDVLMGKRTADDPMRFFGSNFYRDREENGSGTFKIAYVKTTNDLITQCAHDIYSILLDSLVSQTGVNVGEVTITQETNMISWTTTAIADATKHFVATGLGSALDASLCISAALSPYLCDDETTAYAILRTFVEYHKPNSLYNPTMYSDLTNGRYSKNDVETCVLETDTALGLYDDLTKLGLFEEYILICLCESHRSRKNADIDFYFESKDWPTLREDCKEVCEITEKYESVLTAEARNKKSEEWLEQFLQKRDWSGLLGYLTWGKIDAEKMTNSQLLYRILGEGSPRAGQVALVLALLQSGLDPDKSLKGALGIFAKRGKTALLRLLLDFGARPGSGLVDNPLVCAAEAGQVAALDILLRPAKISPKINSIPHDSLVRAIQKKQVAAVARLMEDSRIDVKKGLGPALQASDVKILRLFLKDSRIGPTDIQGLSISAACESSAEVAKLLLDDPRFVPTQIQGLLISAAGRSSPEVVKLLLGHPRVDPTDIRDLLIPAAGRSSPEVVKLLLDDPRVDPNAKNSRVGTALHRATQKNRSEVVKVLLEDPRVDPSKLCTISSWEGDVTPLDIAITYGEDLKLFRGAFHEAVSRGITGSARKLRNMDRFRYIPGSRDQFDQTALEQAEEENTEITELLQNADARSA